MSEKTAEEKLRQELEGSLTEHNDSNSNAKRNPKPLRPRQKLIPRRNPDNVRDRIDTFMDDFERRIEQSLNTINTPSDHQEKTRPASKKQAVKHNSPDTLKPEPSPLIREAAPIPQQKVQAQPSVTHETHVDTQPEALEPEPLPDDSPVIQETEILPEVQPVVPEPELPDIPVLEAESSQNSGILPDIPVILPEEGEDDDTDPFTDDFSESETQDNDPEDDTVIENDTAFTDSDNDADTEPENEEPSENKTTDFQEAELIEAPEIEDEFADILDDSEELIDDNSEEEPLNAEADEVMPSYAENDVPEITADDTPGNHNDFTPSADIVVNVDDELPQLAVHDEPTIDPEAESVPVTVTMPESTKTAEDKLMADIAEAMTGSPLTLDTQSTQGLYNLPEDFFTSENNGTSQSAEDKLKANIAQALSESPIAAAQSKVNQNLEDDLNPFDDISMTDFKPENLHADETTLEEPVEENEPSQDFSADTETETEPETDEQHYYVAYDDSETPPISETAENEADPFPVEEAAVDETDPFEVTDNDNEEPVPFTADEVNTESDDPFALPEDDDNSDKMPADPEISEEAQAFYVPEVTDINDDEAENTDELHVPDFTDEAEQSEDISDMPAVSGNDNEPETQSEHEDDLNDFTDLPFSLGDDDETEEITPVNAAETEQDMLAREVEAAKQGNQFIHEEANYDNKMPGESLLNDNDETAYDTNDDFDMSSLGELSEAASIPEDDNDVYSDVPETVTEVITKPDNTSAGISHNPEDEHKEKTMSIREKLASRKNSGSGDTSSTKTKSSSGTGGLIMPVLMTLLLIVGGLIFWQLLQLSDKLTSLSMNTPGFESVSVNETKPSYDYAIDFILDPNLTERMAQRGRDGWQVVGSRRTQDSTTGQYGYELIFMRRTQGR